MKRNFLIIIFSFLSFLSFSQDGKNVNQATITYEIVSDTSKMKEEASSGLNLDLKKISSEMFNKGSISDVSLLIQGKVEGLGIYNKGGDPNKMALMQIRGINTMGQYIQPLMVVNGIVGASFNNIDPNDIEHIEVLKDGASCSKYGIRGAMGVILIQTKKAKKTNSAFTYTGQGALSQSLGTVGVLNYDEFIEAEGIDFGSKTDWLEEISRQGFTSNHHVAAQVFKGKSGFRVSANYRDVQGVIKESGFTQLNLRTNFNTLLLNDKLKIDLSGSYTNRKSDLGIEDLVKYTIAANPTLPIYGKDAIFPFNSAQYGGYFELIGLFEGYNPVSILNQSFKRSNANTLNLDGNISYQILNDLNVNIVYGYQSQKNDQNAFFPTTAYYKGIRYRRMNGLVESMDENDEFTFIESSATYRKKIKSNHLLVKFGYTFQKMNNSSSYERLEGFNKDYTFDEFEQKIDTTQGVKYYSLNKNGPQDKLLSYFTSITYQIKDYLSISGSLNRDGSSRLGTKQKWGLFPSISGALDLTKLWNISKMDQLSIRTSYGVTGNLPRGNGMSQKFDQLITFLDTSYTRVLWQANPDLKWEEKRSINFGIDFSRGIFTGSINIYNSKVKDLIQGTFQDTPRFENMNTIQTRGLEIALNFKLIDNTKMSYGTGMQFSSYKSVLKKFNLKSQLIGGVDHNYGYILLQEGEEIGNIVGPIYEGKTAGGLPIFKDVNKDGFININPEYNENTDLAILGKGTPDIEMVWSHQINVGKWQLNALFRCAFGHSMVNINRFRWESQFTNLYNIVKTPKSVDGLKSARFHSLFVEKADFVKLDNITISRKIALKKDSKSANLLLSLTGHNLFVITGYTSGDPEPSLNFEYSSFETLQPTLLKTVTPGYSYSSVTPGLDLRSNYLTSRSFIVSVGLEF